jgi:uncharacterized protein (TIGR03083 family)
MPKPIYAAHLLGPLDKKLLELLTALSAADWNQPTIVPAWTVKHITAHLLDGALRKLSAVRDGRFTATPQAGESLAKFINRLNAEGVAFYIRYSPAVLMELLSSTGPLFAAFHEHLDPHARAKFPVSWAGETESVNWFDTARELTERWHHQEQIRLATGAPSLTCGPEYPFVLDCFLRALPHAYRNVTAAPGTGIQIECGDLRWYFVKSSQWELVEDIASSDAEICITPAIAWRIFTNGLSAEEVAAHCKITGRAELAEPLFSARAIVR